MLTDEQVRDAIEAIGESVNDIDEMYRRLEFGHRTGRGWRGELTSLAWRARDLSRQMERWEQEARLEPTTDGEVTP